MYHLKYSQKIPITLNTCWDFFSNPAQLKNLTPEHLCMQPETDPCEMYAGQIITYTIRPIGNIPLKWVTEITHVQKPDYFIDEQRFGPYKFWHHEHRFKAIPNGVEIIDLIYYQLPLGPLGKLLHAVKVKQDLEAIFAYRKTKLETLFGIY